MIPDDRKVISIVSPCYNEAGNVAELADRIRAVFAPLADRYDFEAILVENGSHDGTYEELLRVRAGDLAGRDGTWVGPLGPRRFAGGVHLEAAAIRFDDGRTVAVPLGDLERFV